MTQLFLQLVGGDIHLCQRFRRKLHGHRPQVLPQLTRAVGANNHEGPVRLAQGPGDGHLHGLLPWYDVVTDHNSMILLKTGAYFVAAEAKGGMTQYRWSLCSGQQWRQVEPGTDAFETMTREGH